MKRLSAQEIGAIYDQGKEAVVELAMQLQDAIERLEARVSRLETQINQNSQNSSKPPSSDGFKRPPPRSLRKKSGRRSGGQEGHPGSTLLRVENPDQVIEHWPARCCGCGQELDKAEASGCEARQVHDIPPIKIVVTEHRAMRVTCPACQHTSQANFPEGIKPGVGYGNGVVAMGVYATAYQLLPLERTCELLRDIVGCELSEGTLVNQLAMCADQVRPIEADIKAAIIGAEVAHFDETGARVMKKPYWLHVASTAKLTYYAFDESRGGKAFDRIGILSVFKGKGVHDALQSYLSRDFIHCLCDGHILRELTGIEECTKQRWPARLKGLLVDMKERVDQAKENGKACLPVDVQGWLEAEYDRLVTRALRANPRPEYMEGQRGRPRASPARNLAERLRKHKDAVLRFLRDFSVPFDNNQAERDLRMMKVKQKVSGCFRAFSGAEGFCLIRSYVSTLRKQGQSLLAARRHVCEGNPLQPQLHA